MHRLPFFLAANFLFLLAAAAKSGDDKPKSAEVPVRVDERVELLSIIFRLVGPGEYHQTSDAVPYAKAVDEHFGPFKEHETIKLARKLRRERRIGFDAVAWFAVHLKGGPRLEAKVPYDNKKLAMESRWKPETAAQ